MHSNPQTNKHGVPTSQCNKSKKWFLYVLVYRNPRRTGTSDIEMYRNLANTSALDPTTQWNPQMQCCWALTWNPGHARTLDITVDWLKLSGPKRVMRVKQVSLAMQYPLLPRQKDLYSLSDTLRRSGKPRIRCDYKPVIPSFVMVTLWFDCGFCRRSLRFRNCICQSLGICDGDCTGQ